MSVTEGWRPVGLTAALKRIKNIPQWERGLASKPELKAEWDAYFSLLPKWIENVYTRLDEKNHIVGADDDASDESREINWMKQRLSALQTGIDFAAQEALAPPPEPKFAPPKAAEPKPAPSPAENASKPAEPAPSSAPPKASEDAQKAAAPAGMSTSSLWLVAGAIALGALLLASRKR